MFEIEIKSGDKNIIEDIDITFLRQFSSVHLKVEYVDGPAVVRIKHKCSPKLTVKLENDTAYSAYG